MKETTGLNHWINWVLVATLVLVCLFTSCIPKTSEVKILDYRIEVKYMDNTIDTIALHAKAIPSQVKFQIKTVEYGFWKDTQILPTLYYRFYESENIAVNVKSFRILNVVETEIVY